MTNGIYLLLGSNLGDKRGNLEKAVEHLDQVCPIAKKSSLYQTDAWGKTDQPQFINQALEVSSSLTPHALLEKVLQIEGLLGRKRITKWGERQIDIDILFYGSKIVSTPELTIPHPEIQNRRFALMPMVELAPQFVHPVLGKTMAMLLTQCIDPLTVELL